MSLFDGLSTAPPTTNQASPVAPADQGFPDANSELSSSGGDMFSGLSFGGIGVGLGGGDSGGPFGGGGGSAFGFLNSGAASTAEEAAAAPEPTESAFGFLAGGGGGSSSSTVGAVETSLTAFSFVAPQPDAIAQPPPPPESAPATSAFNFLSGGGLGGGGAVPVESTSSFPSSFASSFAATPATSSFDAAALTETTVRKRTRKAVLPGHASRASETATPAGTSPGGQPPPPPEPLSAPKAEDAAGAASQPAPAPPPPADDASSSPAASAPPPPPPVQEPAPFVVPSKGLFDGLQEGSSASAASPSESAQEPPASAAAPGVFSGLQESQATSKPWGPPTRATKQQLGPEWQPGPPAQALAKSPTEPGSKPAAADAASHAFRPPARKEEPKPQPPPPPPPAPKGPDLKTVFNVSGVQQWMDMKASESSAAQKAVLEKLAGNININIRTADDIAARREMLAAKEAEQNRLVDSECFEEAGALDLVIQDLKDAITHLLEDVAVAARETEGLARDLLGLTRDRQKLADEALCKVAALQREGEDTMADLDARNEKKLATESARLESERKRMDLARSHIAKDSEHLGEERRQVTEAIEQQSCEHVKEREHALEQRTSVDDEIKQLQRTLEQKMEQRAALDEIVNSCDIRIASIRSKFEKQLSRLEEKQSKLEEANREVEQDAQQVDQMASDMEKEREVAKHAALQRRRQIREIKGESRRLRRLRRFTAQCEQKRSVWQKLLEPHHEILNKARQKWEAATREAASLAASAASKESEVAKLRGQIDTIRLQLPSLEADKKMAVSSRSFKEAGRITEEIKRREEERKSSEAELEALQADLTAARERLVDCRQREESAQAELLESEATCAAEELRILRRQVLDLEALCKAMPADSPDKPLFEQEMRLLEQSSSHLAKKYNIDVGSLQEIPAEEPAPEESEGDDEEEEEDEGDLRTEKDNGIADDDAAPAVASVDSGASPAAPQPAAASDLEEAETGTVPEPPSADVAPVREATSPSRPVVALDPVAARQRLADLTELVSELKAKESSFEADIDKAVESEDFDRAEELEEERKRVAAELEVASRDLVAVEEQLAAIPAEEPPSRSSMETPAPSEQVAELEVASRDLVAVEEQLAAIPEEPPSRSSMETPAPSQQVAPANGVEPLAANGATAHRRESKAESFFIGEEDDTEGGTTDEDDYVPTVGSSCPVDAAANVEDNSGCAPPAAEDSQVEARVEAASGPSAFGFVTAESANPADDADVEEKVQNSTVAFTDPAPDDGAESSAQDVAAADAQVPVDVAAEPAVNGESESAVDGPPAFGFVAASGGVQSSEEGADMVVEAAAEDAPPAFNFVANNAAVGISNGGTNDLEDGASGHTVVRIEDSPAEPSDQAAALTEDPQVAPSGQGIAEAEAETSGPSAFGFVAANSAAPNGSEMCGEGNEEPDSSPPSSFSFLASAHEQDGDGA